MGAEGRRALPGARQGVRPYFGWRACLQAASQEFEQSLLSTNLKNWGYERENQYDRGWIRFCCAEEFKGIFLREEIHANWRRLAAKKWSKTSRLRCSGSASDAE